MNGIRKTAADDDGDQSFELSGGESADEFARRPARKRRKAKANTADERQEKRGKPSRQRVRGRLAALPEMPLDILYEIFRNMHPRDLLQASRTTKTLRSVLMSKSSIWIWKDSHAASDLPPVPPGMTVPQFVGLAYDRFCHFCSAPSVNSIIWIARVRCCRKCMLNEANFTPKDSLRYSSNNIILQLMSVCSPTSSFFMIFPSFEISDRRYYKTVVPIASVLDLYADYERDGVRYQSEEEMSQWIAKRKAQVKASNEHAALCEAWDAERQAGRDEELQNARDVRKAEILRRLKELGWADEIRHLDLTVFGDHELVRKPQPLTERIWRRIQGPLLEYLEGVKTERLAQEKMAALCSRRDILVEAYREFRLAKPFRTVLPGLGDIVTIQEIARVIENTPYDQVLTKSDLRALLDAVPQSYFDDWRDRCDTALVGVLNSSRRKTSWTKADLKLATTVFAYKDGFSNLSYPLVLVSDDLTRLPWNTKLGHDSLAATCRETPWSSKFLRAPHRHIVKELVVLAGLDPKTATPEEMDELDPWYACLNHPIKGRPYAMTWRYALSLTERDLKFELLSKDDANQARSYVEDVLGLLHVESMCVHCHARFAASTLAASQLMEHLTDAHGRATYRKGTDYALSFDDGRYGGVAYLPYAT